MTQQTKIYKTNHIIHKKLCNFIFLVLIIRKRILPKLKYKYSNLSESKIFIGTIIPYGFTKREQNTLLTL